MQDIIELDQYLIRRKIFKFLGASFHVFDGDQIVAYTKQKAFKLKEDIRIYTGEDMQTELLTIRARNVIDFAASYDIVDAREGTKVGAARRKGFASIVRDSWELLDREDRPIGKLQEDSTGMALLRRFLSNLIPQSFHLDSGGRQPVELKQHFNPFVYRLAVSIPSDATIDRRLVLGVSALIAAIEGCQD